MGFRNSKYNAHCHLQIISKSALVINMRKVISISIIILIITGIIATFSWYEITPNRYVGTIPSRELEDSTWEASMFLGEGAYYVYTENGFRKDPPISRDRDLAREDPSMAVYSISGIGLNGQFVSDGYWQLNGGLIDWIEGDEYRIELYGKQALRWKNYWPIAWDNYVYEQTYDYFLLQRNKKTNEATLIKEWRKMKGAYGILSYKKDKNELLINICGTIQETIPVEVELSEDNFPFIICTAISSKQ